MTVFWYGASGVRGCDWSPSVDVYESPEGWILKFDLAGVRPEDVEVEVEGMTVRVRGTRRDWLVQEGWRHRSMEIAYCRFERAVTLPAAAEGGTVASEYRDGMLILRIRRRKGKP